ncbi:phosphatidic acid phosphatase type 2/haloperoxidase [Rhizoctonia solani]|nr:phosphatidic acid phosphatase type 2/haloperoxidase [Rhizoctonia solani]
MQTTGHTSPQSAMNSHHTREFDMEGIPPAQTNRKRLGFMAHIPTLRQYIQDTWLDLLVVICVGALALGLNAADNASTRQFPIVFREGGDIVYPTFSYPRRKSIIPIWLDALLAILIPTLFFFIAQIRVRSFYDLNTAFWGVIWAIASTTLFQVFIKTLIGGFRPHFLSVCNPDLSRIGTGTGFQGSMYDISICSPDANKAHLRDATKSFPSGHTTAAAAGYVYLSLYFNAKMKIFSNERPHFYKLLVFLAPLLGASLIGGVLTVDNSHHWYDVVAGAVIGTIGAFAAFRMSYASIWDYRFNHIPLPRPKSSWTPFEAPTHDGHANGSVEPKTSTAPEHFSYTTGVPIFPSFAHPRDWCPAGAPGDAWPSNELSSTDADFQRQRLTGRNFT